jgi:uncharacterized protein (DUF2147 family)
MTPRTAVCLLVVLLSPGTALASVTGCWVSEAGTSVIELAEQNGSVTGRVVGLAEPLFLADEGQGTPGAPRTDLNNPEPALRERAIAGLAIVAGLRRDGDRWTGGTIYDPESGNTYSVRAEVDDEGLLRIRGYIGSPLFGRTTKWNPMAQRTEAAQRMLDKLGPYLPAAARPPSC